MEKAINIDTKTPLKNKEENAQNFANGYLLSEDDHYLLEQITLGLEGLASLQIANDEAQTVEVSPKQMAAILRVFSKAAESIAKNSPFSLDAIVRN